MNLIKRLILVNLLFLLLLSAAAGCSSPHSNAKTDTAFLNTLFAEYPELKNQAYTLEKVTRIVDGDTFETEGKRKIRLIGVNSPESTTKVEYYGKEASAYTKKELTGKRVYLFRDAGDTDKYGRFLRYVFVDGQPLMFNERLAKEGYANPMTIPPNVMYSKRFVSAEREAREKNAGLWAAESESKSGSGKESNTGPGGKSGSLTPDKASGPNCDQPKIKGNINSKKEHIYHVPEGRYYDQTQAEELFCTEEEALSAGYRKSAQ